jgi:hypothetical protein
MTKVEVAIEKSGVRMGLPSIGPECRTNHVTCPLLT